MTEGYEYRRNVRCPKCGQKYSGYPAISRRDNKTEICPQCGVVEALDDWIKYRGD